MKLQSVFFGVAALAALAVSSAVAAGSPSVPQVAAVASELDVGVDDLVSCSLSARGKAVSPKGSDARRAEMAALLLPCLQASNPALTAPTLSAVLDRHRPQPAATD